MADVKTEEQVVIGKPRVGRVAPINHLAVVEVRDDFGRKKVRAVAVVGSDVYFLPREIFEAADENVAKAVLEFFKVKVPNGSSDAPGEKQL